MCLFVCRQLIFCAIPALELQVNTSAGPLNESNSIASDIPSERESASSIPEKDPSNSMLVEDFDDKEEDYEVHSAPKKVTYFSYMIFICQYS